MNDSDDSDDLDDLDWETRQDMALMVGDNLASGSHCGKLIKATPIRTIKRLTEKEVKDCGRANIVNKFSLEQTIYYHGLPTKVLGFIFSENQYYYFVDPVYQIDDETFSLCDYYLWEKAEKSNIDSGSLCDFIAEVYLLDKPMTYNKGDIVKFNGIEQKVISYYGNDGEEYYHLDQTNHVVPLERIKSC